MDIICAAGKNMSAILRNEYRSAFTHSRLRRRMNTKNLPFSLDLFVCFIDYNPYSYCFTAPRARFTAPRFRFYLSLRLVSPAFAAQPSLLRSSAAPISASFHAGCERLRPASRAKRSIASMGSREMSEAAKIILVCPSRIS